MAPRRTLEGILGADPSETLAARQPFMDFQLTEDQQLLRDSVRRYATETLPELAEQIEQSGEPPSRDLRAYFVLDLAYLFHPPVCFRPSLNGPTGDSCR